MISQSINSYKLPLCARHTGSVVVTTEESLLKELLCSGGRGVGGDGGKTGKFPTAQKSLHFILGTAGGHQGHSG